MTGERVHLFDLRERTSAAGNRYLSGWLGKASVVAFLDRDADEPTWQVFVSTPSPRTDSKNSCPPAYRQRGSRRRSQQMPADELNDDISDLGGASTKDHIP